MKRGCLFCGLWWAAIVAGAQISVYQEKRLWELSGPTTACSAS